jgi:hypothetical protein
MSVNIQTGNVVKIQNGNRVLISAPGPQGPAGTGGGGTWGSITGTLEDQADLQTALDSKLENGDSPTFSGITLTGGTIATGTNFLDYTHVGTQGDAPELIVRLNDGATDIGYTLLGFRGDDAGSGTSFVQGSSADFRVEQSGGSLAAVYGANFHGGGADLTGLNASNITTGTLSVANGGTGATTLAANAVLIGNGTSALQTVAPSTSGNVLTSNGTTWTSAALSSSPIKGYKRASYDTTASGTTTCTTAFSTFARAMTEGTEFMEITYTPTVSTNRLRVEVRFMAGSSSAGFGITLLGRSGDTNARVWALTDNGVTTSRSDTTFPCSIVFDEEAGTTSAITYKVRFGGTTAGTFWMNRSNAGAYPPGISFIEVTEYTP